MDSDDEDFLFINGLRIFNDRSVKDIAILFEINRHLKKDLEKAMEGHIIKSAELMGTFQK